MDSGRIKDSNQAVEEYRRKQAPKVEPGGAAKEREAPQSPSHSHFHGRSSLALALARRRAVKRVLIILGSVVAAIAVAVAVAFPALKRHQESLQCGNYMASIGCAARLWAGDHDGRLPSDLLSLSNEVIIPTILICPGDHLLQPAARWAAFTTNNSSYEVVTTGLRGGDTNGIFFRCRIHGHLGYADGTVFDGTRRRTKVLW